MIFKQLANAVSKLADEIAAIREERKKELATKADILASEQRIIDAIQTSDCDAVLLTSVLVRAEKLARRVEKLAKTLQRLDAQT